MNEMHSEQEQPPRQDAEAAPTEAGRQTVSVKRILLVVVPVGLLIVAGTAFFGVFDGAEWVASLLHPPLVRTEVQVTYRGQPVPNAMLITQPAAGLKGAIGMPESEPGRYVLQTDIQGYYHDGAYAGEHKVSVAGYGVSAGASAPPLLTPQSYSSLATTDLVIVVSKSPESNHFALKLEDDESAPADGGGAPGGEGTDGGPPTAEEMVERAFDEYDKDGDQKLSGQEFEQIDNEQRRAGIQQADTDGDGAVDRQELTKAVEAFLQGRQGGLENTEKP